jgi:hypothetical protein
MYPQDLVFTSVCFVSKTWKSWQLGSKRKTGSDCWRSIIALHLRGQSPAADLESGQYRTTPNAGEDDGVSTWEKVRENRHVS